MSDTTPISQQKKLEELYKKLKVIFTQEKRALGDVIRHFQNEERHLKTRNTTDLYYPSSQGSFEVLKANKENREKEVKEMETILDRIDTVITKLEKKETVPQEDVTTLRDKLTKIATPLRENARRQGGRESTTAKLIEDCLKLPVFQQKPETKVKKDRRKSESFILSQKDTGKTVKQEVKGKKERRKSTP